LENSSNSLVWNIGRGLLGRRDDSYYRGGFQGQAAGGEREEVQVVHLGEYNCLNSRGESLRAKGLGNALTGINELIGICFGHNLGRNVGHGRAREV
jgi:hypothetical protein